MRTSMDIFGYDSCCVSNLTFLLFLILFSVFNVDSTLDTNTGTHRSGNWCSRLVTKQVSCLLATPGTETYLAKEWHRCWYGQQWYNCQKYRVRRRLRYVRRIKVVHQTEWHCCVGYSGENCDHECFNCTSIRLLEDEIEHLKYAVHRYREEAQSDEDPSTARSSLQASNPFATASTTIRSTTMSTTTMSSATETPIPIPAQCICPPGMPGARGTRGTKGPRGHKGDRGEQGLRGTKGSPGTPGMPGNTTIIHVPAIQMQDTAHEPKPRKPRGDVSVHDVYKVEDKGILLRGPIGPPGAPGQRGRPGLHGPKGDIGLPGPPGEYGLMGAPGEPGFRGLRGEPGQVGVRGKAGMNGAQGEPGTDGERGPVGLPGPPGPAGASGHADKASRSDDSAIPDAKDNVSEQVDLSTVMKQIKVLEKNVSSLITEVTTHKSLAKDVDLLTARVRILEELLPLFSENRTDDGTGSLSSFNSPKVTQNDKHVQASCTDIPKTTGPPDILSPPPVPPWLMAQMMEVWENVSDLLNRAYGEPRDEQIASGTVLFGRGPAPELQARIPNLHFPPAPESVAVLAATGPEIVEKLAERFHKHVVPRDDLALEEVNYYSPVTPRSSTPLGVTTVFNATSHGDDAHSKDHTYAFTQHTVQTEHEDSVSRHVSGQTDTYYNSSSNADELNTAYSRPTEAYSDWDAGPSHYDGTRMAPLSEDQKPKTVVRTVLASPSPITHEQQLTTASSSHNIAIEDRDSSNAESSNNTDSVHQIQQQKPSSEKTLPSIDITNIAEIGKEDTPTKRSEKYRKIPNKQLLKNRKRISRTADTKASISNQPAEMYLPQRELVKGKARDKNRKIRISEYGGKKNKSNDEIHSITSSLMLMSEHSSGFRSWRARVSLQTGFILQCVFLLGIGDA